MSAQTSGLGPTAGRWLKTATEDPDEDEQEHGGRPAVSAADLVDDSVVEAMLGQVDEAGLQLTGQGGFLPALIKACLEKGLGAELSDHLGYQPHERTPAPAGGHPRNARNGSTPKTLDTEVGPVELATPRDRTGTFEPRLVPKGTRRLAGGLDEMIISLYAGGMTVRDIQHHLARTIGVDLSHETIANITDAVMDEVTEWQTRALDPVYPIVYIDALVVKVRDNGHVSNKSAHIAVGVDTDGIKHVLGIWVQTAEGAKFWLHVLNELKNRGVKDVLIVCCDGLEGLPDAIETVWPHATTQTCVVHLIRSSMRFVAYGDRKPVAQMLRPVYAASNEQAALDALAVFADSALGKKYPSTVATWERAWEKFIPFLDFGPEVRRVIYTTNAIESLNYQLRKIIKNRGHFPNDDVSCPQKLGQWPPDRILGITGKRSYPCGSKEVFGRVQGCVGSGGDPELRVRGEGRS